jgi:mono/diheme cytochrome c family protein
MRRLGAACLLVLALVLAGCGGGEEVAPAPETVEGTLPEQEAPPGADLEGNPTAGEQIYADSGCGSCHVFEAAGSTGTVGPNLDESDIDFEGAVEQIANGGGGMPAFADQLSEEQIRELAEYVIQATG